MTPSARVCLRLSDVPHGQTHRIHSLTAPDLLSQRLRDMGFFESAPITKLTPGSCFICLVSGARLALNQNLAREIWVQPSPAPAI